MKFDLFGELAILKAKELDVDDPHLPHQRKFPCRFHDGLSPGDFPSILKTHFKQVCFGALDLIINCVQDQFDQLGYRFINPWRAF